MTQTTGSATKATSRAGFAALLKSSAEASGITTTQGKPAEVETTKVGKAATKGALAGMLKKSAAAVGQKTVQGGAKSIPQKPVPKTTNKQGLAAAIATAKENALKANEPLAIEDFIFDLGPVSTWAFSTLKNFEVCPHMVKLAKIDKVKQESSPAAERGNVIHLQCEDFIQGKSDAVEGDRKTKIPVFQPLLDSIRADYEEGKVEVEQNWGIRKDWSPCEWSDEEIWGRSKLDVFIRESQTSCHIIDWKTGRKFGNEFKHSDQGICYALKAAMRYPELEVFKVHFAYLDQGENMIKRFTRSMLDVLHKRFHFRARKMTTATEFPPKSNPESCRFCPYGCNKSKEGRQYGNGHCSFDHYRGLVA